MWRGACTEIVRRFLWCPCVFTALCEHSRRRESAWYNHSRRHGKLYIAVSTQWQCRILRQEFNKDVSCIRLFMKHLWYKHPLKTIVTCSFTSTPHPHPHHTSRSIKRWCDLIERQKWHIIFLPDLNLLHVQSNEMLVIFFFSKNMFMLSVGMVIYLTRPRV